MALNQTQLNDVVSKFAAVAYANNVVAHHGTDHISAAAAALDSAFDTTLSAAVTAVGGSTTVMNGLAATIPAPFNTATAQQKTLLCCYVLMKRVGLI